MKEKDKYKISKEFTNEVLEELGWELKDNKWCLNNHFLLIYDIPEVLWIFTTYADNIKLRTVFEGWIYKKSDLKRLMKQLNING